MNQKWFIVPFESGHDPEMVNLFLSLGVIYFAKTWTKLLWEINRARVSFFPRSRVVPPNGKSGKVFPTPRLLEWVAKLFINSRWFLYLLYPFLAEEEPECNLGMDRRHPSSLVQTGLL